MTTHDFRNDSNQAERKRVERDTYLTRAQADTDLAAQGRFKKETTTRVTGVPTYPSLPANSPWVQFDQNVEPELGFSVEEMPAPAVSIPEEPTPSVASSAGVGSEPVAEVASFPASSAAGSSIKRRSW
jgi:hypothetical protein